jgi:large subunit ribosomal protein L23
MTREQLMNVLLAPHVTEKTSLAMQNSNQYVFRVQRQATKVDIKQAVELMFDVKVKGVQVLNEPGKTRRFGRMQGRTQDWKKQHGTHQVEAHISRYALRRARRPLAPVQGQATRAAHRLAEQDGGTQSFWPHDDAPHRRRLAAEVPPR